MIRILFFLIVVFALGLGFAWLADRPGDMVVTFSGYQYQVSLMVAAVAVTAVVAAVMILWWLVKAIWNSPYTISRYFRVRRRDRGYQALSTGMIAAGAGDGALARKMNKQAAKLIRAQTEPLIQLLDAQASLLEGDHETAREQVRGDARRSRNAAARPARALSRSRAARRPHRRPPLCRPRRRGRAASRLGGQCDDRGARPRSGDWDGALKLVESQKATRQIERDAANRRRAVLLTAKAQALFDTDPAASRNAALEANKLLPGFAPAAVAAAKALFKHNDLRKGAKILEAAWRADAHPDVGALYVHARPGDAVNDRLTRARKLQSMKQNNAESALLVARAALEAGDYKAAREAAEVGGAHGAARGRLPACSPTSRRPRAAIRAACGSICRRRCVRRAIRPGSPTASCRTQWAPVSPVTGRSMRSNGALRSSGSAS